jgi:nitrate reductase alpha subunit
LLYYLTGSLTSSFWFYYNRIHNLDANVTAMATTEVPTAISLGKYEISWASEAKTASIFTQLKSFKLLSKGSHFLAHEEPELVRAHGLPLWIVLMTWRSLRPRCASISQSMRSETWVLPCATLYGAKEVLCSAKFLLPKTSHSAARA